MEKLVVFKVVEDMLELCGYFNSKEDVKSYLGEINRMINDEFQHNLKGDYIAIPVLHYQLQIQDKTKDKPKTK